jgi:hypothetical protein
LDQESVSQYGPPGPSAYKIDTLFINRRIDEQGFPASKIIRLGSLREIGSEFGLGSNTNAVKKALLQNATTTVAVKFYGREQGLKEQVLSRYSLIFHCESLPNGAAADCVYLVLNDLYLNILNSTPFRPLNLDYMKSLAPMAQRFYEIASYQIYAALQHGNPRAKISYCDFCSLSTATRYQDFKHIKKQMHKVMRPHLQSDYIAKIEYELNPLASGQADWTMFLTPGSKAMREYRAFNHPDWQKNKQRPNYQSEDSIRTMPRDTSMTNSCLNASPLSVSMDVPEPNAEVSLATDPFNPAYDFNGDTSYHPDGYHPEFQPAVVSEGLEGKQRSFGHSDLKPVKSNSSSKKVSAKISEAPTPQSHPTEFDDADQALVEALVNAQLNRWDAERLVRDRSEVCRVQLAYLPYVTEFTSSQGAYLRTAIEREFGPLKAYELAKMKEATAKKESAQRANNTLVKAESKARQSHQERMQGEYDRYLYQWTQQWSSTHLEAFQAFVNFEDERRKLLQNGPFANRPLTIDSLKRFDLDTVRAERVKEFCQGEGRRFALKPLNFWQWDHDLNPQECVG